MVDFSHRKDNNASKNMKEIYKTFHIKPEDKHRMEEICEQNSVEYTVKNVNGVYEFSIKEDLLPRIQNHFLHAVKEKIGNEEQSEPGNREERKADLLDQIGAAQTKAAASFQAAVPQKSLNTGKESGPTFPSEQHSQLGNNRVNKGRLAATEPKNNDVKDLTKDFGILTLEEQKRLEERQTKSESEKRPKQKRTTTGRDRQVKTRLTETEWDYFRERVKASGMKQGDFIRACLLYEEVNVRTLTDIDAQTFEKIMEISSDLGRVGGLLKGTVMVNKDSFAVLTPDEKRNLEREIRELNTLKAELQKVVQKLYGNS